MEWVAWEAWAAEENQQMPQVGEENRCVSHPGCPQNLPGTGAQGVELEAREDHERLMRHGTGPLEGLDVCRESQGTFGPPWATLRGLGGLLRPQEMGVPGDPD